MDDCFLMLQNVIHELPQIEGVLLYSMFMLPAAQQARRSVYEQVLQHNAVMHGVVENIVLKQRADIAQWERIFAAKEITGSLDYAEIEKWL